MSELLKGATLAFFIKVLAAGFGFFLNVAVARNIGAEEAGYFFLVQTIVIICSLICRQGMDNSLVRYISEYRVSDNNSNIIGLYFFGLKKITILLPVFVVMLFFGSDYISVYLFNKEDLAPVLIASPVVLIAITISQYHSYCFQGEKRIIESMLFQASLLSVVATLVLLISRPNSAKECMLIYGTCSSFVCFLSCLLWFKIKKINIKNIKNIKILPCGERERFIKTSKPLFMILLLNQVTQWLGMLLLGVWANAYDIALFVSAQKTAMLTSFVLVAVNAIAAPKFAEAYAKKDFNQLKYISVNVCKLIISMSLPIVLVLFLFSSSVMSLFGSEFINAAPILRILIVGQFVNLITGSVGYLLQMTGYEKLMRNNVVVSSLVMGIGGYLFIPNYGTYGAATVTTIAISIQNLLGVWMVKKHLGFNTINIFQKSEL
ncbi:oligosaccharide flippase family protein [Vibrio sp. JC009]|uniref:oligosaccharide flippase family protein n=1 Tax=Vibrio sp. JC009 TaxID=2912314 RepID=UPI0023B0E7AA|nr:oligosaccharide flippase family protein [Vibrio sp. JC009]WED20638.1 oligosaccharide flippase family protein [Vibrio sp. JC009]